MGTKCIRLPISSILSKILLMPLYFLPVIKESQAPSLLSLSLCPCLYILLHPSVSLSRCLLVFMVLPIISKYVTYSMYADTGTQVPPHPLILSYLLFSPLLLPAYGSTSQLGSVMSLACLAGASRETNLHSCNTVIQGKHKGEESMEKCASDCFSAWTEEWS